MLARLGVEGNYSGVNEAGFVGWKFELLVELTRTIFLDYVHHWQLPIRSIVHQQLPACNE
jgi:hypothetical protein